MYDITHYYTARKAVEQMAHDQLSTENAETPSQPNRSMLRKLAGLWRERPHLARPRMAPSPVKNQPSIRDTGCFDRGVI